MNLTKNNYSLKAFKKIHITDEYISWLNNPVVNKFLEIRHNKQNLETVTNYISAFYQEEEKYLWGIYHNNQLIGTTNLTNIDTNISSAELGLMIGNISYWGKAASTEALNFVLDFAFNKLHLQSITGGCYETNIGIVFTFKRLGFIRENIRTIGDQSSSNGNAYQWRITKNTWNDKC